MAYKDWKKFWQGQPKDQAVECNLRTTGYDYDKAAEFYNERLKIKKEWQILDAGCGNGLLMKALRKYSNAVTGVDISKNLIESVLDANKHDQFISAMVGDILNLPFSTGRFDLVLCIAVFQYLDDLNLMQKAVDELVRVCRFGGIVYLGDVINSDAKEQVDGFYSFRVCDITHGYNYKLSPSYFDTEKRHDIVICK